MASNAALLKEEEKVEKLERQVLKEEKRIEETLLENGEVLKDLNKTRKAFIRKIARHKFLFTMIASTGIILVWRGIWEISATLPFLSGSFIALIAGLGILWLIERYSDLH